MRGMGRGVWPLALGALLLGGACTLEERPDRAAQLQGPPHREIVQPEGVARLPVFSSAVRTGNLLFLSGALGALQSTEVPTLVAGGIVPETHQTMENIRTVLESEGLGFRDLVKCTVFLADIADYAEFNEAYVEYFPEDPPARSALAASGLALGAQVEVECIAAYPEGS